MSYDQSGPVTVNETKSLLVLVALLATIGGGTWLALRMNQPQPVQEPTKPAAVTPTPTPTPVVKQPATPTPTPTTRVATSAPTQPATLPWWQRPVVEGINRFGPNRTVIKIGSTQITISHSRSTGVNVSRTVARDDVAHYENWQVATSVIRALNDADAADRLGLTLDQIKQLRALDLKPLSLTAAQTKIYRDLFEQAATAQGEKLAAIDSALIETTKAIAGNKAEVEAFDEKIAQARKILTPEQITDIREMWAGRRPARGNSPNPNREMP